MSESKSTWFFMNDYKPIQCESEEAPDRLDAIQKQLDSIDKKLDELNNKINKVMQSNKSLIAYYEATNARDLNYKIRSYSSKSNPQPPVNFIPDRLQNEDY